MTAPTDLDRLLLRDFQPRSNLVTVTSRRMHGVTPAVDSHNHLGRWHTGEWKVSDPAALVGMMDVSNVASIVNLDGCWADELEINLDRYDRAFPGRFVSFARLDWRMCADPGWGDRLAGSLLDSVDRGAAGLKVWKDVGLRVRDEHGQLIFLDDERLAPIWSIAGDAGLPVVVHTADPVAFFTPLDRFNERVEELSAHPDWHFYGDGFPPLARLLEAWEAIIAKHPGTTFIGAHVGGLAEDLGWVDRMLSTYSNFHVDIAARIAELGRQPRRAKALIESHPGRVLLGTDVAPPTAHDYELYFRFLESADEHFEYSGDEVPGSGRWRISALDLTSDAAAGVEGDTARRIIPRLRGSLRTGGAVD